MHIEHIFHDCETIFYFKYLLSWVTQKLSEYGIGTPKKKKHEDANISILSQALIKTYFKHIIAY